MEELAAAAEPDAASSTSVEPYTYGLKRAWYALTIFEIQLLAVGIDLAIVSLLVKPIETAIHINDVGFATVTATAIAFGILIGYYPAGVAADTFKRRNMIVLGSILWAAGAIIACRADSFWMLFLARLLAGFGTGLPGPAVFSMLSDAFPHTRRALAMSAYGAGYALGTGIGLAVCSGLVAWTERNGILHLGSMSFAPWQQCFIAIAAMGLFIAVLVLTVIEPPRQEVATKGHASNPFATIRAFGRYLRQHWFLWALLLLAYPIAFTGYYGVNSWGPAFGLRNFGVESVSAIAILGGFTAAGAFLGSVGGGVLAQRGLNHGDGRILPKMLMATSVICGVMSIYPFLPTWTLAATGIGALYASLLAMYVLITIVIQETTPNEIRGQLLGLIGISTFVPETVGPTLVAWLANGPFVKSGGLAPALGLVNIIFAIVTFLLFVFCGAPYERARNATRALMGRT